MSFQAAIDRYDGGVMEVRTEARALERWSVGGRSLFQRDFRRQAENLVWKHGVLVCIAGTIAKWSLQFLAETQS